jgi:hypothetical protein
MKSVQVNLSMVFKRLAVLCVLASCTTLATAGDGTSADELLKDADQVFQQLDAAHYAALWLDAAPFVKARVPRDEFVGQLLQARQSVGAVSHRGWASITRIRYNRVQGVPDGLYANVDFASILTSGRTVFEMLSFRLDDDGQWHLTGYVPRLTQNVAAAQMQIGKP